MTNVIAFPRRSGTRPLPATLNDQSLNEAFVACLVLGTKIETIVDDLERNLARVSATLPDKTGPEAMQRAQQIAELERKLELARAMIRSVRADLSRSRAQTEG